MEEPGEWATVTDREGESWTNVRGIWVSETGRRADWDYLVRNFGPVMDLAEAVAVVRELAGAIDRGRTAKAPEAYVRQAQMYQMGGCATEVGTDCQHRIATTAMHAWLEQAREDGTAHRPRLLGDVRAAREVDRRPGRGDSRGP